MQSNNFTTLFVLSREREVEDSVLDVSAWTHMRLSGVGANFAFLRHGSTELVSLDPTSAM